jgi:hypothetical protein
MIGSLTSRLNSKEKSLFFEIKEKHGKYIDYKTIF